MKRPFLLLVLSFFLLLSLPVHAQQKLSSEDITRGLKQLRPQLQVTPSVLKRFQGFSIDMNGDGNKEWILFENPNIREKVIPPKICPCLKKSRKGKAAKLENIVQWGKSLVDIKVLPPEPKAGKKGKKKRRRRRRRVNRHLQVWLSLRHMNAKSLRTKAVEFCKRIKRPVRRWRLRTLTFQDTDSGRTLKIKWKHCRRLTRWMPTRRKNRALRRWFRSSSLPTMTCGCRKKKKKRGYVYKAFKPLKILVATRVRAKAPTPPPAARKKGKNPVPPPPALPVFKLKKLASLYGTNPRLTAVTADKKTLGLRLEKRVKAGPFSVAKTQELLYVYLSTNPHGLTEIFKVDLSRSSSKNNPDGREYTTLSFRQMDNDSWLEIIATHYYEDTDFTGAVAQTMFKWNNGRYAPLNQARGIRRVVVSSTWKHPASRSQKALATQVRKRTNARNLIDGFPATLWIPNRKKRGIGAWLKILFRGTQKLQGVAISTQPDLSYFPFVKSLQKSGKKFPKLVGARFVKIEGGLNFSKTYELKGKRRYHFLRFPSTLQTSTLKITIVREMRDANGRTLRIQIPDKENSLGFLSEVVPVSAVPRFVASSYHKGALNSYPPAHAGDGTTGTGWGEGRKDDGVGEWLQMILPIPRKVTKLRIINGCHAAGEKYILNNRIKTATLTFSNGTTQNITLKDGQKPQTIHISAVNTSTIKLTITSFYKGKIGHITCLSEIQAL